MTASAPAPYGTHRERGDRTIEEIIEDITRIRLPSSQGDVCA
jgi:hypothetical protein